MKKLFLILFLAVLVSGQAQARTGEQQRKISSDGLSSPTVVSSTPATLFDVEIVATAANAWVAVYDSASKASPQAGVKLVEISEATSGNGKHVNLGVDGLTASKGITVWMANATSIVTYH